MSGSTRKNRVSFGQRKEHILLSGSIDDRRDGRSKQHSDIHPDDNWKVCIHYQAGGWWKISCKSLIQAQKLFIHSVEGTNKKGHGIEYIVLQERGPTDSWCDYKTFYSGDRAPTR